MSDTKGFPARMEAEICSSVRPTHQSASVKFVGLGFSAIAAGPFPLPLRPWQVAQFAA